ncbi:MAG: FAD binding domain-containing protein [Planctomycetota bacterium]
MKRFAHLAARDFPSAARALQNGGVAKAGGTDLLDLLKERIVEPDEVVDLRGAARALRAGEISALQTLAEVASDENVLREFPALAKAAGEAATPQIRNFATVGGNLCQGTRCWYFRNASFSCTRRGDPACAALVEGAETRYHAIFPEPSCVAAHSSNLAPALIALGARVACVGPGGERVLDVERLYREPEAGRMGDTVLEKGELIRAVLLEPSSMTRRSAYLEFRERLSFDFAVVAVAAALDLAGGVVKECRIVLGAVAPVPYRAEAAERALRGKKPDDAALSAAAEAAVEGARPLAQNGFKVPIAKTLVRRALEGLLA